MLHAADSLGFVKFAVFETRFLIRTASSCSQKSVFGKEEDVTQETSVAMIKIIVLPANKGAM